ncbi:MAG: urea ABC transporter permease subunit UrtB, partial [Nitratireductor sp.]
MLSSLVFVAPANSKAIDLQSILQQNHKAIEKASRKTVAPVLKELSQSGLENVQVFLENWRQKNIWMRKTDGLFFYVQNPKANPIELIDLSTNAVVSSSPKGDLKRLKPNSGVRSVIAATLVRFQLTDANPQKRQAALDAISR